MTAKMKITSTEVRLLISDGVTDTTTSSETTDSNNMCRFYLTGLDSNTEYTYQVQVGDNLSGPVGTFRTLPTASSFNFTCAFSGDANTGSTNNSFNRIRLLNPLFFIHMGDLHYENISTNSEVLFHAAYDSVLRSEPQALLYQNIPTVYVWDDHDYGPNNSNGSSVTKPAATAAYRSRVPHYPLVDGTSIYHTFDVGRVRFVITDQRSAASANAATDNSSKTMLGTDQKTWFKNILSNSPGKLIVWVCPRWFGMPASTGADHWGGFTTERTELCDYIKVNCHGRVIVLSADLHTMGVDDGTNHDFATGGGEPLPCFQAAALDQTPVSGGGSYTEGEYLNRGQFGTMEIVDSGTNNIEVTWRGYDSIGNILVTHNFLVSV